MIQQTYSENIVIKTDNLLKQYGYGSSSLTVLKNVSISINKGEIVSIMGPSGAGKSTLLHIIGCLDTFQGGSVQILHQDIAPYSYDDLSSFRNAHIGFIFQMHNLMPEFTALENTMMPLLIMRQPTKKAKKKALELLDHFGIADRAHHKPAELSGGECQRIAVARALITHPDIILADEPTGNLDRKNSDLLIDLLFKSCHETGTTVVIVTHDQYIASKTQRVITLIDGMIQSDVRI
ncbi:MAG: ABC transporter ATP-binding protein [Spirochaetes bacterium]|nr:ABC transporter ATP-binding protein [Spirochaetota bacterium]